PHVAALGPPQQRQPLLERPHAGLIFRIVRGGGQQHADAPHHVGLLRARRQRPRYRRAAEKRDELAAVHSITSPSRPVLVSPPIRATCKSTAVRFSTKGRTHCDLYRVPLIRTRAPIGAIRWT